MKIKIPAGNNLVVGGNGGVNYPTPIPPDEGNKFTGYNSPEAPAATEEDDEKDFPLPRQMNAPVGPPPPPPVLPSDYAGYVELAKKVSVGERTDKAMIWVALAQAEAMNRIGDLLEELVDALSDTDEDDGMVPSVLSAAIANGFLLANMNSKPGKSEKAKK